MIRVFAAASCLALAGCTTVHADGPKAFAGEWTLLVPDQVAAHLRQGKPLRFRALPGTASAGGDLEHCGQICHTYRVCDSDSPPCHNELICVDNPNCDGHEP